MDIRDILSRVDHTLLAPTATWEQIKNLCDEGIQYGCASVCIPPCYVKAAKDYVDSQIKICTVIGFPNGYNTTEVKCFEARQAVENGADEIDMVINLGLLKEGKYAEIGEEIKAVKSACGGKGLKGIIETGLLTHEEKIMPCRVVSDSGADFIKTSTGFSGGGATAHDIALFSANVSGNLQIKAAGGIAGIEDAETLLGLGATRLGTSRIVKAVKANKPD